MPSPRFERDMRITEAATDLADWFHSLQRILDNSILGVATDAPHRSALLVDSISRNAREICEAELDGNGGLYSPTCFLLATAVRHLGLEIRREHWKSAIENTIHLHSQLEKSRIQDEIGLQMGTPASLFRGFLCEAARNAGVLGERTSLNEQNRKVALGLTVNWGMRLLLAYALSTPNARPRNPPTRDLAWIRETVHHLLD